MNIIKIKLEKSQKIVNGIRNYFEKFIELIDGEKFSNTRANLERAIYKIPINHKKLLSLLERETKEEKEKEKDKEKDKEQKEDSNDGSGDDGSNGNDGSGSNGNDSSNGNHGSNNSNSNGSAEEKEKEDDSSNDNRNDNGSGDNGSGVNGNGVNGGNASDLDITIHKSFSLYSAIVAYYTNLSYIIDYMNHNNLHPEYIVNVDISQTQREELTEDLHELVINFSIFNKLDNDDHLIKLLSDRIIDTLYITSITTDESKIKAIIQYIREQFFKDKNTVLLYAKIMQDLIDKLSTGNKNNKQLVFYILGLIEEDKDFFISGNIKNTLPKQTNRSIHLVNPALKRFGFIPVTDSMELHKLIPQITDKQITNIVDLKKLASQHSLCFIILKRVVYTPIEYNLRPLINRDIAANLIQPETYGVSEKTIMRFKTMDLVGSSNIGINNTDSNVGINDIINSKQHNASRLHNASLSHKSSKLSRSPKSPKSFRSHKLSKSNTNRWDFGFEIIGEQTGDKFYVLETLDNKHYRALAPWLNAKGLGLNKFRVSNLLAYLNSVNEPNRISNYHAICTKQAIGNMFLPNQLSLTEFEEHAKNIDTQIIRNDLYLKIVNLIHQIITKEYNNGKRLISEKDLNNIIHDKRIRELFDNIIFAHYNTASKYIDIQEYTAGVFPFYELLSSFLVILQDMSRKFMKDLHDGYNRDPLPSNIFELSNDEKINAITGKINEILLKNINILITDKDNIYSVMNYKYLILNYGL